jgi:hypothetical protein
MPSLSEWLAKQPAKPQATNARGLMDWLANLPPKQQQDYDTLGYIAKYGMLPDQSKGEHLTDEFKMPNHMTFSDESMYSNPTTQGGNWKQGGQDLWAYTPSEFNLKTTPLKDLMKYFQRIENPGTALNMPNGKLLYRQLVPWNVDKQ